MTSLRFTWARHALAMRRPFVTSQGRWERRELCVVSVTDGVHTGLGEGAPLPGFSQESFEACVAGVARGVALMREQPPALESLDALRESVAVSFATLPPSSRFALEGALLDLMARRAGVPLRLLLREDAEERVPVNVTLGAADVESVAALASDYAQKGFSCFKLKVGEGDLEADEARVRAVRAAIGPRAELRLDANGAWSVEEAIARLSRLAPHSLALVEQPVAAEDLEGLAAVARATQVTIAADEAVGSLQQLERVLTLKAAAVVVLKPMMLGVFDTLEAIRRIARVRRTCVITTLLEGVVGRAMTAQLAAAAGPARFGACGLMTGALLAEDLAEEPWRVEAGELLLSAHPGIGIAEVSSPRQSGERFGERPPLPYRARSHGDRQAVITASGEALSYGELYERAARVASRLSSEHGVRRGDRVAIWSRNHLDFVIAYHALVLLGATLVPLHPRWREVEAKRAAQRVSPRLVLIDEAMGEGVEATSWELPVMALSEATRDDLGVWGAPWEALEGYGPEDRAAILFTSGTTGEPKMASLLWRNMMASALGSTIQLGHLPGESWLAVLPLCHIGGLSILMRCALLGTRVVLHERFEARAVAEAMVSGEVSMVSLVSAMLWEVLEALREREVSATLRFVLLGGGPIPASLVRACEARRIPLASTYGMTETGSQMTTRAPLHDWMAPQSAGAPLLYTEVMARGEHGEGELHVRGPSLFEGYLEERGGDLVARDPRDARGWFATGDWGSVGEHGEVQMRDRRRDLIVTGGENVYPAEVEEVLLEQHGVQGACVVGLPDERWGERVVAVVQCAPGARVDEESVLQGCAARLARFKVPRSLEQWEELPRSSLQKLDRASVRATLMRRAERSGSQGSDE